MELYVVRVGSLNHYLEMSYGLWDSSKARMKMHDKVVSFYYPT